ncbi:hypothetical protein DM01DRAFT_1208000 [Hesseltinella vesiculosa]|uniref:Uncharacterized protein n=1 Tax=Hesseltinella vesiculosa TaxID=101127 RepID=A0A1X2GQ17_9FUNG|nr:hypothetical protein DM01DRAFT_1208000 [Hesseltinella vesiculosa]
MSVRLPEDLFIKFMEQGIKKGLLPDCIPTIQHDAYLSRSYILQTCSDTLSQQGRATIADLANQLHVHTHLLSPFLPSICTERDWTKIDDILMTRSYIDQLKTKHTNQLEHQGSLALLSVTNQTSLPHRFILDMFQDLQNTHTKFDALPDQYFTKDFIQRQEHAIFDALTAASMPVYMPTLAKDVDTLESLFYVLLDRISKRQDLPGSFLGRRDRSTFIPNVYRGQQEAMVQSLLLASGYIEYTTVEQNILWAPAREWLQKRNPDLVLLEACAVIPSLTQTLEASLDHLDTWLSIPTLFPSAITIQDALTLTESVVTRANKATKSTSRHDSLIIVGHHITSPKYLQSLVDMAQPYITQRAQAEQTNTKHLHSAKPRKNQPSEVKFTAEEVQRYLVGQQLPRDFAELVAVKIKRSMNDKLILAMKSIYLTHPSTASTTCSLDQTNRAWTDNQGRHLLSLLNRQRHLLFFSQQALGLFDDASTKKSMEKYIVRQRCLDFLFFLVLLTTLWHAKDQADMVSLTGLRGSDIQHPDQVKDDHKKEVIAALVCSEPTYREVLVPLHEAVQSGKKLDAFMPFLIRNQSHSNPLLEKLDWTTEMDQEQTQTQTNQEFKQSLLQQLKSTPLTTNAAPLILHLVVLLLFQDVHQLPLNVSGKFVPALLRQLSPHLDDSVLDVLERTQSSILFHFKQPDQPPIDMALVQQTQKIALDL